VKRLGVIGGLGAIAGDDVFFKLIKLIAAGSGGKKFEIIFEQHPFAEGQTAGGGQKNHHSGSDGNTRAQMREPLAGGPRILVALRSFLAAVRL